MFLIISIVITLSALNGCSYFVHHDPTLVQVATPTSTSNPIVSPNQIVKIAPLESCDDHCSKSSGIKKKFCIKKCEYKTKRLARKALIALCESKQKDWWSRLINRNKDSSADECSGH